MSFIYGNTWLFNIHISEKPGQKITFSVYGQKMQDVMDQLLYDISY